MIWIIPVLVLVLSFLVSLDFFDMRRKRKFLMEKRAKETREREIADRIDHWHALQPNMELHEYLGMTLEQYERWLRDPDTLLK